MENLEHTSNTSHTTAEENQVNNSNSTSDRLVQYEEIEFPFTYVAQNNKEFIAVGDYKIEIENFTKQDYINLVKEKPWHLILKLISICISVDKKLDKSDKTP